MANFQTLTLPDPHGAVLGSMPFYDGANFGVDKPIPVLKNLLANSDFSGGTTGWGGANATISTAGGILTCTGNGAAANPQLTASPAATRATGNIYYINTKARATSADCTSIRTWNGAETVIIVQSPAINVWYTASATYVSKGVSSVHLYHYYADAVTANGKSIEVDSTILIDLTATFGAGLEPSKEEMDKYLSRYANSWFTDTTPQLWSGADWIKRTQNACRNAFANADFSNGTTGWGGNRASRSVTSGVLSCTADGTGTNPGVYQNTADLLGLPSAVGDKVYMAATARVTNADCTFLKLYTFGVMASGQATPVNGTWYTMSHIVTAVDASGNASPAIYHYYVDGATASGKVMEVKYPVIINLTATFGAGNEPTKTEMDYLLSLYPNSWFNGTVNDLVPRRNIRDRIGSGSPEGVITAPVGTNWTDILSTGGATKWIKAGPVGSVTNTGWEPTVLNTGWRTGLMGTWLINGWTATAMYVQRVGPDVVLQIEGLNASACTAPTFLALPTGFTIQNSLDTRGSLHAATVPATIYRTSRMDVVGATTGTPLLYGSLRWRTHAAVVPTALPGTAF